MGTPASAVSVAEYLRMPIEGPDCEYVDGEIHERPAGEQPHSWAQAMLAAFFCSLMETHRLYPFPGQRVQVSPTRFRVPDLCVVLGGRPNEAIFTSPPFLCVEILSPDDRATRLAQKIGDYLAFGVRYVWVVDPGLKTAWIHTSEGSVEVHDGILRTGNPEIALPISRLW